jgi:hypothetical protein
VKTYVEHVARALRLNWHVTRALPWQAIATRPGDPWTPSQALVRLWAPQTLNPNGHRQLLRKIFYDKRPATASHPAQ